MLGQVCSVKAVIVLDNEGQRLIAKYYDFNDTELDTPQKQKKFEKSIFQKSIKGSKVNLYENEVMSLENSCVGIYRVYSDMSFYVIGGKDDNELCLG
jgi:hypothetical protein